MGIKYPNPVVIEEEKALDDSLIPRDPRKAFSQGMEIGYIEGHKQGEEKGYAKGFDAGHKAGYESGFDDATRKKEKKGNNLFV